MEKTQLTIDLHDREDIRRKLPRIADELADRRTVLDGARKTLKRAENDAQNAQAAFDHWERVFSSLRALVPEWAPPSEEQPDSGAVADSLPAPEDDKATSVDVVVGAVNDARREVPTREVRVRVAAHGLADDTVSWALWKASKLGRIRRIKRGRYAPLDAASEQSELAVSSNGTSPTETPEPAPDTGVRTQ